MESVLANRSSLWVFHAVVAVAAGCLLWAFSVPGISVLLAPGTVLVLGLATLLWAADVQALRLRAEWTRLTVPGRLGAFRITAAYRVPGGAVFYEANGSLFDDAGFAYLPDGPNSSLENGSFESPAFKHLGGGWYRWTASW